MRTSHVLSTFAAVAAIAATADDVRAQSAAGPVLSAHVVGARFDPEQGGSATSVGIGLGVGYRFGSAISLRLVGEATQFEDERFNDDFYLWQLDLLARYTIALPAPALRAYAEAGVGTRRVRYDDEDYTLEDDAGNEIARGELLMTGSNPTVGAGVEYLVFPSLAIEAGLRHSFGSFGRTTVAGRSTGREAEPEVKTTRLAVGVAWSPTVGRR